MLMLDAISAQQFPSLNRIYTLRAQPRLHNNKFVFGNDNERWAFKRWNCLSFPEFDRINKSCCIELKKRKIVVIRAVATLEPKCSVAQINGQQKINVELGVGLGNDTVDGFDEREYLGREKSEEVDEKEKLRRMRISKANKGNTPWNKGKKHSADSTKETKKPQLLSCQPNVGTGVLHIKKEINKELKETRKRIKERTRIAMQSPKVKMKLINLGHAQSKETRAKIGVGVRAGWERRRERLKLQETCYFEWQNLIAEACRRGSSSEQELQWDSYKILDKELEQEWIESVEKRKKTPRPKGNKRAPKSPEQRRKISEAISAKWADAGYRDRVCSALSKYYGAAVGVGKKPRKQPSGEAKGGTTTKNKTKDMAEKVNSSEKVLGKKRSKLPTYKDPFASSKLEMIKSIRAQRAASELKKTEAFKQAKVLICEAERAAKALEASAMSSPLAQASLVESRELIAQAIQSLNSIENGHFDDFNENGVNPLMDVEENANGANRTDNRKGVDGFGNSNLMDLICSFNNRDEAGFSINGLSYDVDETDISINNELDVLSSSEFEIGKKEFATNFTEQQLHDQLARLNGEININGLLQNGTQVVHSCGEEEGIHIPLYPKTATKKWVRGRLVESAEGLDQL